MESTIPYQPDVELICNVLACNFLTTGTNPFIGQRSPDVPTNLGTSEYYVSKYWIPFKNNVMPRHRPTPFEIHVEHFDIEWHDLCLKWRHFVSPAMKLSVYLKSKNKEKLVLMEVFPIFTVDQTGEEDASETAENVWVENVEEICLQKFVRNNEILPENVILNLECTKNNNPDDICAFAIVDLQKITRHIADPENYLPAWKGNVPGEGIFDYFQIYSAHNWKAIEDGSTLQFLGAVKANVRQKSLLISKDWFVCNKSLTLEYLISFNGDNQEDNFNIKHFIVNEHYQIFTDGDEIGNLEAMRNKQSNLMRSDVSFKAETRFKY